MAAGLKWRWYRRARKAIREFGEFWVDFATFIYTTITGYLYRVSLPVTSRLFTRRPKAPTVTVKDIRCKRIRLNIEANLSSPFNVEEYEVQWSPAQEDDWASVGTNDITQRTVARLKPDSEYKFRVRAYNRCGWSDWTEPVFGKTKQEPKDGGGTGPNYTWTQTATEVSISFEVPSSTKKSDVKLSLQSDTLEVTLAGKTLLSGPLPGKVRPFSDGSYWEITKEYSKMLLTVVLEKQHKSMAPKFDYWRSVVPDHTEIDTHHIPSDPSNGPQMMSPGNMDPIQMQKLGLLNSQ